jgi:hypothetical protein
MARSQGPTPAPLELFKLRDECVEVMKDSRKTAESLADSGVRIVVHTALEPY